MSQNNYLSQTNQTRFHLRIEKEEPMKSSKWKKRRIQVGINEIEKKTIENNQ